MGVRAVLIFALAIHLLHFVKGEKGNRTLSPEEDLQIEKELKLLRKHARKTIKTENGDIYDCVDFYKQPAFDNPLLKNHTYHFQTRPNFHNGKRATKKEESRVKQQLGIGFSNESCPVGTVPIRRNTKEDVIRAKLFENSFANNFKSKFRPQGNNQYIKKCFAIARTTSRQKAKYHGAGAILSVYNPKILPNEYSSAQITLRNGQDMILVGWTVNPRLYPDMRTRLFIFYSGNSGSCFNTRCPGFVVVNTEISVEAILEPITRRGKMPTRVFYIFVQQDVSGNWWLQIGPNIDHVIEIGFWPRRLFRSGGLMQHATYADWGGEAFGSIPEMGNGHMAVGDTKYDSFCGMVNVLNEARRFVTPKVELFANSLIYNVKDIGVFRDYGRVIVFGGPY